MSQARNINFIGQSGLFGVLSIALVIGSWVLVAGGNLTLGIDFAGGTEALVSLPASLKVSDQELKSVAESVGLENSEVINYAFQTGEPRQGYFIRSVTQRGLIAEKGGRLRETLNAELGATLVTWDDKANTFTVAESISAKLSAALEGKGDAESPEGQSLVEAAKVLKSSGVTVKDGVFTVSATAKDSVTKAIGSARIKLWDTSDESGERIRVQFYNRPDRGVLTRAADKAEIVGASVSAENETRSPVFAISADDSVRLRTALVNTFKTKLSDASLVSQIEVPRFEKVGATAGQQLRNKGILAVIYALIFILLYIALRFDPRYSPGAIIALIHDVSITLGVFCITGREFNLPIIAALLAIVGYSLNDTIVVYDRIRENQDEAAPGSTIRGIINSSINDCLSRTILTSVTTFLAVLAIQTFGGGIIENFAFAMLVGVIAGTYSSIYIASPLVLMMDNYFEQRAAREAAIDEVLAQ